ncbi:DoxX family protein [Catalinimonas sp. 4WD22]|uniref:DoxX family protein n=1 Tax=Catalinimonas locisalis TaxID=3133978 RepID=UPI0031011088
MTSSPSTSKSLPQDTIWTKENWSNGQKLLFRFGFTYLALYILPNLVYLFISIVISDPGNLMEPLVLWVGETILDTGKINIMSNGSGDTTYNYVEVFTMLCIAILSTLIWTLLDHKRKQYRTLLYYLTVGIRYMLGVMMFAYGLAKVFKIQFADPSLLQMLQTFGEMSPMGLLWKFMGYSLAYNIFTGMGEVIGGVLLFFRRTTTLGAMILIAVLSNVVILNFTFDVPVKLFSSHLLLMCIILFLLDSRRVMNLLLFNRTVQPMQIYVPFQRKRMIQLASYAKVIVLLVFLGSISFQYYTSLSMQNQSEPPLFGIYEVQEYIRNQDTIPADGSYETRWKNMIVDTQNRFHIQDIRGNFNYYKIKADTSKYSFAIMNQNEDNQPLYDFTYRLDSTDLLTLRGVNLSDSVFVKLKRKDYDDFLLTNRGFHWVNEYPFNR